MNRHSRIVLLVAMLAATAGRPAWGQQPQEKVAGIEVGGKSVKFVVLEGSKSLSEGEVTTNITTSLVKENGVTRFHEDAIARTVDAVEQVYKKIRDDNPGFQGPFFLVASSGVSDAVGGNKNSLGELGEAVEKRIREKNLSGLIRLDQLTVEREVGHSFLGVTERAAPQTRRAGSILADIGSGNTKFGFSTRDDASGAWVPKAGSIPLGTNTYRGQAALASGQLEAYLSKTPGAAERPNLILTGGIVWAMVTLEKPEDTGPLVTIDADMIERFRKRVDSADPYLVGGKRVAAVTRFSREQLKNGTALLVEVAKAFGILPDAGKKPTRTAVFSRDGLFAWITGYTVEQAQSRDPVNAVKTTMAETRHALLEAMKTHEADLKTAVERLGTTEEALKKLATSIEGLSTRLDAQSPKSEEILKELIEIRKRMDNPSSAPARTRNTPAAWTNFWRGMNLYESRLFQDAAAYFMTAIGEDDEHRASWYALALTQYQLGLVEEARQSVINVVRLRAAFPDTPSEGRYFVRFQGDERRGVEALLHEAENLFSMQTRTASRR